MGGAPKPVTPQFPKFRKNCPFSNREAGAMQAAVYLSPRVVSQANVKWSCKSQANVDTINSTNQLSASNTSE